MKRPIGLLVEDDSVFREIIGASLEKRGYDVVSVDSFEKALVSVEEHFVSFVVADIFMPGMGGIEGIRKLKRYHPNLPVIAISGGWDQLSAKDAVEAASKIGADACVRKPIDIEEFNTALKTINRGNPAID